MNSVKTVPKSSNTLDTLRYRRQFLLAPGFASDLPDWKRSQIHDSLFITYHPELPLHQVTNNGKTITLLGYILDPYHPKFSDLDILNDMVKRLEKIDDIFCLTYSMGGRWVLIVQDKEEIRLLHDAAGTRQVVYSFHNNQIWCASQAGLIADRLGLQIDPEIRSEFIESEYFQKTEESFFPNDVTPFKEVKLLIPNHYLNLKTGKTSRYWPNEKRKSISLSEGVQKSAKLLSLLMESASNRFELALTTTAGLDSRVLLAASKNIRNNLYCYTLVYSPEDMKAADITVPAALLPKLGLKHNCFHCPPEMSPFFKEIYMQNTPFAHESWGRIGEGIYTNFPKNKLAIKGNAGEIGRRIYRLDKNKKVDGSGLAGLVMMDGQPFAIKQFSTWLSAVAEPANKNDYNILDLFYWEQRMGQWQAMSQLEWDIAQEVFTPYNCRELIVTILGVDSQYRKRPNYIFQHELIKTLWPETLDNPINPRSKLMDFKYYTKHKLIDMGVYRYIKKLKSVLKKMR